MSSFDARLSDGALSGDRAECPYRLNLAALVRVPLRSSGMLSASNLECVSPWMYVLCKRSDHGAWQCPQGGLELEDSSLRAGVLRELHEELGLHPERVRIIYESRYWRRYDYISDEPQGNRKKSYKGQQQKWFLVEIDSPDDCDLGCSQGEFCEIELVHEGLLHERYAIWKAGVFVDFLREIGLAGTERLIAPPEDLP